MLLEQYECGPIAFSGAPGALYERHVVFDHVVRLERADSRQRFEAVAWARRAIKNVGHSGRFSSDRTILEYVREIWKAKECPVDQG